MKKTIILNAGHSLSEPGAAANNTTEAQEAIKIRDKLTPLLRQNFEVVEVPDILNIDQSLEWIKSRYDDIDDGLAFSIHLNAGGGHGAEIFYYDGDEGSRKKAQIIIDKYCNLTRFRNRGVKPDTSTRHKRLGWIRDIKPWSFLIECCFIDTVDDIKKLQEEYDEVAWGLYAAICAVYEVKTINPKDGIKSEILDVSEVVERVVVDFDEDTLYVDSQKGLNVRATPDVTKGVDNRIGSILYGEEVAVIEKKGRWFKVRYGDQREGWVASEYLTEENPKKSTSVIKRKLSEDTPILFEDGRPNFASSENTKRARKYIYPAFTYTEESEVDFQCVEYVHYKVKKEVGLDIPWELSDRPRDGGKWANIFKKKLYKVTKEPTIHSAMSFANPTFNPPWGHVAFVEEVFGDESIKISETNWPHSGIYNERILSKQQWSQEKWGAEFINFRS